MLTATVRDECLNINTCWSLTHARFVITGWKDEYNHHRRHSAQGYEPPRPERLPRVSTNNRLSLAGQLPASRR